MNRILLAANDTPAGIAAARAAIGLAAQVEAQVLALHVVDGSAARVRAGAGVAPPERVEAAASAVLRFVSDIAAEASVPLELRTRRGRPAIVILEEAAGWQADLIVLGRAGYRRVGAPFVGSEVLHVLEFAEVPVLVVPAG